MAPAMPAMIFVPWYIVTGGKADARTATPQALMEAASAATSASTSEPRATGMLLRSPLTQETMA